MKTRVKYEDLFHKTLSLMLPDVKKSNIRASHSSKSNPTGKNFKQSDYTDGLEGFTNEDNFVYFTVLFDVKGNESFVTPDDKVGVNRDLTLKVSVYGKDAMNLALQVTSLCRTHTIENYYMNPQHIYLSDTEAIRQVQEVINGQMWDRRDFDIKYNETVIIEHTLTPLLSEDASVEVVTNGTT